MGILTNKCRYRSFARIGGTHRMWPCRLIGTPCLYISYLIVDARLASSIRPQSSSHDIPVAYGWQKIRTVILHKEPRSVMGNKMKRYTLLYPPFKNCCPPKGSCKQSDREGFTHFVTAFLWYTNTICEIPPGISAWVRLLFSMSKSFYLYSGK